MAGNNTANMEALIRAEVWSTELKEVLLDDLEGQRYIKWLDGFPDGNQFTIPSIGQLDSWDYSEDTDVSFQALDTGEFNFSITEYVQSGTYITNKAKQDLFYSSQLISSFVPREQRAIQERLETDILKQGQPGTPNGQTVANLNLYNGAPHRFVGSNVISSKQTIGVSDFAKARYVLKKANVPDRNLIALVDPSVEYYLNTITNLVNVSNNPHWEGIIDSGIANGPRFVKNVFGFDVYTSDRIPLCGTNQTGTSETINSVASGANATCNLFFSATPDLLPWIGAWRQMPKVDGQYNMLKQREEFVTTARYGTKLYRPENFVTILNDSSAV